LGGVFVGWDLIPGPNGSFDYVYSYERTEQFSIQPAAVPAAPLGGMMLAGFAAVIARRVRSARH
jgi:hypothetical protein